MIPPYLKDEFPQLGQNDEITSPPSDEYNCIAWAAGDNQRWWWPIGGGYWPSGAPREETIAAFLSAFQSLGYTTAESKELVSGFEKVALYVNIHGKPTHMARQLSVGVWTSKLGPDVDIIHHTLDALEGKGYGRVETLLQRATERRS